MARAARGRRGVDESDRAAVLQTSHLSDVPRSPTCYAAITEMLLFVITKTNYDLDLDLPCIVHGSCTALCDYVHSPDITYEADPLKKFVKL